MNGDDTIVSKLDHIYQEFMGHVLFTFCQQWSIE